ncbi:MAG: carbohydrate ABC transporter permease [Clostridia bacterium]|nr:carbohydrate ABC transporter permease [Clostridia bacterium]
MKAKLLSKLASFKQARNARKLKNNVPRWLMWCIFALFVLYAITLLYPFLWMLVNSFKETSEFLTHINGFPKNWAFTSYTNGVFRYGSASGMNIVQMFGMSAILTIAGAFVSVFFSCCAAYTVSKYNFIGKKLIYGVAVFMMVVPIVGSLPGQVRMMQDFKMYDTVIGLLFLYSGAFGLNFILFYAFFVNISWSYAEAARVDGANDFIIFFRIMIPLAKGPIIAVFILQAIGLWNDYSTPAIFLPSLTTLAVGLDEIKTAAMQQMDYPAMFAAVMITVLPMLVLFACFQKTIMENTIIGGLKG